jgi:hypothetical protein
MAVEVHQASGTSSDVSFDLALLAAAPEKPPDVPLKRGDANADAAIDIGDAVFVLSYLFANGDEPTCVRAADANDDGTVDISDPIFVLQYFFGRGPQIPLPYPDYGIDPTLDGLACVSYKPCE